MSQLQVPEGWKLVTLENCISDIIGGDWGINDTVPIPNDFVRVKIIRATEMQNWQNEKGMTGVFRLIKKSSLEKRQLISGDIILEISGGSSTFTVGRSVLIDEQVLEGKVPVICANFFRKISLKTDIEPKFIHYFLHYFHASKKMEPYISKSTNIQNLKVPPLLNQTLVLPSFNMQKKIVQKLDHVLGKLEEKKRKIINQLEKNILILETINDTNKSRTRQSTLKNHIINKTINSIIVKCNEEKDNCYFKNLEDCCSDIIDTPHSTVAYVESGIPVVRTTNIEPNRIDFSNCKYTSNKIYEDRKKKIDPKIGDILYTREAPWGMAVKVNNEKFVVGQRILLLRPNLKEIQSDFLTLVLNSNYGYEQGRSVVNKTTSEHVNIRDIKKFKIPIIPEFEQSGISSEIDNNFKQYSLIEKKITDSVSKQKKVIQYIKQLDLSILNSAFTGKLVN